MWSDVDKTWLLTFSAQAGAGLALVFFSTTPGDAELGRLLLASAFGQSISAGQKATREGNTK
jgi:hypothetical protein